MENITGKQFKKYEKVRKGGKWNMLYPQAEAATGLDNKAYMIIINNYVELSKKYSNSEETKKC